MHAWTLNDRKRPRWHLHRTSSDIGPLFRRPGLVEKEGKKLNPMQRKSASGRPLGTDGSDFSYRMVVDSRYTKVAKGKSRLKALIIAQTVSQVIGSLWMLLSASEEREFNRFTVLSSSIGFISLLFGELGRRRTQGTLLRLYTIISSIATAFSVACVVRSDSFVKGIQYKSVSAMTNYELIEVVRVLLGVALQIFVIITNTNLLQNMSPPKRSS